MTFRARSLLAALVALVATLVLVPSGGFAAHGENHAPTVTVHDNEHWYVHALMGFGGVSVTACDEDGIIDSILVEVWPEVSSYRWNGWFTACWTTHVDGFYPSPGSYPVRAFAWDAEGEEGDALGTLHYSIIPADPASVPGFPRLDELSECGGGVSRALELVVAPGGAVKAYRVAGGGRVCASTLGAAPVENGDRLVMIEWSLGAGEAIVRVDGVEKWSGLVREEGAWWRIVPMTDPVLPYYDIDPVEYAHALIDFLLP